MSTRPKATTQLERWLVTAYSEEICIELNNEMTCMIEACSSKEAGQIMIEHLVASYGLDPDGITIVDTNNRPINAKRNKSS